MANSKKPWERSSSPPPQSRGDWGNLPSHLRALADLPGERNPRSIGEVHVLISAQTADLADFTHRVWDEINAKLVSAGGNITVTEEELLKYFVTGIYSRIAWVNRNFERGNRRWGFRPDDMWALPVQMHMVISAIGRVRTERNVIYVPRWVEPEVPLVLERPEWENITRKLLALEPFGLRFVRAYEKDESGVEKVMSIIRVDTVDETYFYSFVPPHALEALIAAILGIARSDSESIVSMPLDAVPGYRVRGSWVMTWMHEFSKLSEHRDVAS